jgi:hypothetical protein
LDLQRDGGLFSVHDAALYRQVGADAESLAVELAVAVNAARVAETAVVLVEGVWPRPALGRHDRG